MLQYSVTVWFAGWQRKGALGCLSLPIISGITEHWCEGGDRAVILDRPVAASLVLAACYNFSLEFRLARRVASGKLD